MTSYAVHYPKLRYFFAAYFHQDWSYEKRLVGGSFEDVVRDFQAENPIQTVNQATRELEAFLGLELSEGELENTVVYDLGANVNPPGRGGTYRQWLEAVLSILKKPTRR
jgi:CdiI immunity protein